MTYHGDEELRARLLEAGVPDALLEYASLNGRVDCVRILVDEWFDPQIHLDSVRLAARNGIGFSVNPGLDFDLAVFGDDIERIPALSLLGLESDFAGLDRLPLARSLRLLETPIGMASMDLSALTLLEDVWLHSPGALSVASAPRLRCLEIEDVDVVDSTLTLSPRIEKLFVSAARTELDGLLDQVPHLQLLWVTGARRLDLSPLHLAPKLMDLTIRQVRSVTGTRVLDDLTRLEKVEFWSVSEVDDVEPIERLAVERLQASGAPFTARFVERSRATHIYVPLGRAGAGKVPWERTPPAEDGEIQLILEDLSWITDRLSDDFDPELLSTYHVQDVLEKHLAASSPGLARVVEFDSEGSQLVLVVHDPEQVSAVEHATDRLFGQKKFRAELETTARSDIA